MPLNEMTIRNAKPAKKLYRLTDGFGMYLEVSPNGRKRFRTEYSLEGKRRTATLGTYPKMKLNEARTKSTYFKDQAKNGVDPEPDKQEKANAKAASVRANKARGTEDVDTTWEVIAEKYLVKREREGAAPATMSKLRLHAKVTYEEMGSQEILDINAQHIIKACRHYEQKDMLNSAHAVRILCSQVFRFAIAHGWATHDPAAPTKDAIAKPRIVGYPGITDPKRIGELMRAIRSYSFGPVTRAGLLLSIYLFPRNGEIRRMAWDQIDGDLWTAPASIMKKKREHTVPLPHQARKVLDDLYDITGDQPLVLFTRTSSNDGLMSENTFNMALRKMGFPKEEHVHHGFRITASTILNEQGWNSDWIERQLAHVERNKVRGAYNKALYLDDRRRMMQHYADWLDEQAKR